jgi:peptidyl-prolyl cis-trans isomerase D
MMQELRNWSKGFLIFVVIAFVGSIIFAWGMDIGKSSSAKGFIAKINGEEIDPKIYSDLVQNYQNQVNQNGRVYLDWSKIVDIRNQAWDQMIMDLVLEQYINKIGLKVSDTEMFEYLWNYPPQYFWNAPELQTNGQFDMSKYRQLLGDKSFASNLAYIEMTETPRILRLQWAELLRASIQISPEEMNWEFRRNYEKIKVDYAFVSTGAVKDQEIVNDSAEVIQYYNEHKDEFENDPSADMEFVTFEVAPSATDSTNISDLNIWIVQMTESEQDIFQGVASIVSDDSRAKDDGGEIGWIQRGRYSPEFDSAAFALDSGQITQQPVRTKFGWHILKSGGKRTTEDGTEEIFLNQIFKKIRPSGDTFGEKYSEANQFLDEVELNGFEETIAKYGLEKQVSGSFTEGTYCGSMGVSPEGNEFAFNSEPGDISEVFLIANIQQNTYKFVVARLSTKSPQHLSSQDEAYSYCDNTLKRQKQMAMVYDIAKTIYDEAASNRNNLQTAAETQGAEYVQSDFFNRADTRATSLSNDPAFIGVAFGLIEKEDKLSLPIYTRNGVAVIMYTGKTFNPAEYDVRKDELYNRLWIQKVRATQQAWTSILYEEAEIEDFRNLGFQWFF